MNKRFDMIDPAFEYELHRYLARLTRAEQRKVLKFARELTIKPRHSVPVDSLDLITQMYEGLSEQDIDAIESIIHSRGPFFWRLRRRSV